VTSLPSTWASARIADLVKTVDQSGPEGRTFTYVDISSIDRSIKVVAAPQTLSAGEAPSRARQRLRAGDVLVSMTRPNLNAVALVGDGLDRSIGSTGFCVLRPVEVEPRWLFYAVQRADFINAMVGVVQGALYPAVRPKDILTHEIPLPPVAEQRRIVAAIEEHLSRLDAAVAGLKRVQAHIASYRRSVLKSAVLGTLIGRDATEWQWRRFGELGQLQAGIQKQPSRAPRKNKYPFLRVANVGRGVLDLNEVHEIELFGAEIDRLRLEKGDLLIVEGNGSPSHIGRLAIWDGSITNCVHQNHLIRHRPSDEVLPEWIALYWNSPTGAEQVAAVASSTSGLYTLSVGKISRLPIPLPPLAIQRKIVGEVDRVLSDCANVEHTVETSLRAAVAMKRCLLGRAFAGELVPQDPNDEPASVLLDRIRVERTKARTSVKVRRRVMEVVNG
jgi:type I restriction enzyme, S subunit